MGCCDCRFYASVSRSSGECLYCDYYYYYHFVHLAWGQKTKKKRLFPVYSIMIMALYACHPQFLKVVTKCSRVYLFRLFFRSPSLLFIPMTMAKKWLAQNWFDAFTKAKHIYSRLKQSSPFDNYNVKYHSTETLGIRKSPLNSSVGSRLSSLNNSHR